MLRIHRLGPLIVLLSCLAAAQEAGPQPQTPSWGEDPPSKSEEELQNQEQSQRILGVVPMFSVTSRQNAAPLKAGQKFRLAVKSSVDPFQFLAVGFQAGLGQADNDFDEYGQGAAGYGKRYGSGLADGAASNLFGGFLYPVLLKQDPRYFRSGQGTIKHRLLYSLAQEFVCHNDRGGRTFNWSNVLGVVSAGGLSNVYYPPEARGFGLTMSRAGISLLYGGAGDLINEFWPDIRRKIFHKKD